MPRTLPACDPQIDAHVSDLDRDPEPALAALRALPLEQLDGVVRRWLGSPALPEVRRERAWEGTVTYALATDAGGRPVRLARVHRLRVRLQAHHVEALLGELCRRGLGSGILVATGPCAPEALRLAQSLVRPYVWLLSGPEWLPELCAAGAGVRRGTHPAWLFDASETGEGRGRW